MAKNHGARQQKKVAKLKAKRAEKRSDLMRRDSPDPVVRLQHADRWPVVQALVGSPLFKNGMGSVVIARQEGEGRLVFAVYLVDVYCLGVKNAFWKAGTRGELQELIRRIEQNEPMSTIDPACLVKIVKGAVEYAGSFGFRPHHDYRHAAALLEGIDPATCPREFKFGRDGKPYYIQGPDESPVQVKAIMERILDAGGHFLVEMPAPGSEGFLTIEDGDDPLELPEA